MTTDFEFDPSMRDWTVRFGAAGPAGWIEVEVAGVLVRFDRAAPATLVLVRAAAPLPGDAADDGQVAVVGALLGEKTAAWLRGTGDPPSSVELSAQAAASLSQWALAETVRGDAGAWDVEIEWLRRRALDQLGVPSDPRDSAIEWLDLSVDADGVRAFSPRDDGPLGAALAAGATACQQERFGSVHAAAESWDRCRSLWEETARRVPEGIPGVFPAGAIPGNADLAASASAEQRFLAGTAGPIFLTEHRLRLGPLIEYAASRFDDRLRLAGAPSGPAGTTVLRVADATFTVDVAEPARIVELALTPERALALDGSSMVGADELGHLTRRERRLLVLARDVAILGEFASDDMGFARLAAAQYELALALVALGAANEDQAESLALVADETVGALAGVPPTLLELRAEAAQALARALPVFAGSPPAGAFGARLGHGSQDAADGDRVARGDQQPPFREPTRIDRSTSTVSLYDDVRQALGVPESSPVAVVMRLGPALELTLDAHPAAPTVCNVVVTRDGELVGETTATVAGPTRITLPVLWAPTDVSIDVLSSVDDAAALGRQAVYHERAGERVDAAPRWYACAGAWLARDEPDRAAIALERLARLAAGDRVARLRRAALLGASWALCRPRPVEAHDFRWQTL